MNKSATIVIAFLAWMPLAFAGSGSRVVLHPKGKPAVTVKDEVVASPLERERGLMFRKSMPKMDGMLFLFPNQSHLAFWMRNTLLPLDIIFITAAKKVLGVAARATPMTDDPREVPGDSQFVLEVNGGFAAQHGIVEGTPVDFVNTPKIPSE